jgi:calcium/calmodulin-dependent protein kinase I
VAPEILSGRGYGHEVDYWSIGILIYVLLCGFPPFYEENNEDLFGAIKHADFDFPSPYWDEISDMAKDLIKCLLVVDPKKRISADDIMKHPWIDGNASVSTLPVVKDKIKKYAEKRK